LLAGEAEALQISSTIRDRHLPYGTIIDPVYNTWDGDRIVSYSRCGDSAIWTGHWLAAESYRYAVTRSPEALDNVRVAIDGIRKLLEVTGTGVLARCAFPSDSPYASDMIGEERHHGNYGGYVDRQQWTWIGNTSRDQYMGVFFGLTVAYNLVDDDSVKGSVNYLATRALNFLRDRAWTVIMPDNRLSTTFLHRVDQRLAMLKLGRKTNPSKFAWDYRVESAILSPQTILIAALETKDDHTSYFKFNLDHITFYSLLTGGDNSWVRANYGKAFDILRNTTDNHGNAFFNMIERAIEGSDRESRESATRRMLEEWLQRGRRDLYIDLRDKYLSCLEADRACDPLPIIERVNTDFLWQRSPFLLYGGGEGRIETAGIDYILPYWMARYHGVLPAPEAAAEADYAAAP
jgi:hypothetical protein